MEFNYSNLKTIMTTAGLPEKEARKVAHLFTKWLDSNGVEWVNNRVKALREWYLSYLAGTPKSPEWFAHTRAGTPKGVLGAIFRLPVQGALLALSANTLFVADGKNPNKTMLDKFQHGLEGNGTKMTKTDLRLVRQEYEGLVVAGSRRHKFNDTLVLPTVQCISGTRVPVRDTESISIDPKKPESLDLAYVESWNSVPDETVEFLIDRGHLDWIPIDAIGNAYALHLDGRPYGKSVGQIGFLGQPQLKLRTVANPNRITQATLKPLGELWYSTLDDLSNDCYRNQSEGVDWVQLRLMQGITLASVDMTSATDLLNLEACLAIVDTVYFSHLRDNEDYREYVEYFKCLSRGKWYSPVLKQFVQWKQGQPLGLYPSFALLGLTNNAMATLACKRAGLPLDSYYCLGDDMIIDARAAQYYTEIVKSIGGEVNTSKTMTSNKAAEFAGKVITSGYSCSKAIKWSDFTDDNFLNYASQIGPKCTRYLKPRQRRVWKEIKYAPGIALKGDTYSRESFGEPLELRYLWYLTYLVRDRVIPDQPDPVKVSTSLLSSQLRLGFDHENTKLPWPIFEEVYQTSVKAEEHSGDPRKWNLQGRTVLESYEELIASPGFVPYQAFKAQCTIL